MVASGSSTAAEGLGVDSSRRVLWTGEKGQPATAQPVAQPHPCPRQPPLDRAHRTTELRRGLSVIAARDVKRKWIKSIIVKAGLDLTPAAACLLLRAQGHRLDVQGDLDESAGPESPESPVAIAAAPVLAAALAVAATAASPVSPVSPDSPDSASPPMANAVPRIAELVAAEFGPGRGESIKLVNKED